MQPLAAACYWLPTVQASAQRGRGVRYNPASGTEDEPTWGPIIHDDTLPVCP